MHSTTRLEASNPASAPSRLARSAAARTVLRSLAVLACLLGTAANASAQSTIFEDDFETGGLCTWSLTSSNGTIDDPEVCTSCIPSLSGAGGGAGRVLNGVVGASNQLSWTDNVPSTSDITASEGVGFSGSATTPSCFWQVLTVGGSTISFTDFSGFPVGSITVTGASVSGGASPPCSITPYGCFPPCLSGVTATSNTLSLTYSDGSTGSIAFGCP